MSNDDMDYLIAYGDTIELLLNDVNLWISCGYVPTGGVFKFTRDNCQYDYYGQAMVKKDVVACTNCCRH